MKNSLWRFKDVVLDLDRVVMVYENRVLLDNWGWYDVGGEAADAIRKAIPVVPELPSSRAASPSPAAAPPPGD